MARHMRNQPFCWQEKTVLRLLRKKFQGAELAKYRNLYLTLTEIESDFNGEDVKYYTKTISTYSGLSDEFVPSALQEFVSLGIIRIEEDRAPGNRFGGKRVVFTPDEAKDPQVSVPGKPGNGSSVDGELALSEDSPSPEDSSSKKKGVGSDHTALVDLYFELHKNKYGEKPMFGAAEGKLLQNLLKSFSRDDIERKLRAYYSRTFWFNKTGHDFRQFHAHFNEVVQGRPDVAVSFDIQDQDHQRRALGELGL